LVFKLVFVHLASPSSLLSVLLLAQKNRAEINMILESILILRARSRNRTILARSCSSGIPPFNSPQRGEKFYFFSSFFSAKRNKQNKFQDKESDMDLIKQKMIQ